MMSNKDSGLCLSDYRTLCQIVPMDLLLLFQLTNVPRVNFCSNGNDRMNYWCHNIYTLCPPQMGISFGVERQ